MIPTNRLIRDLGLLASCVIGSLVPWIPVSVPAVGALLFYLPGRFLVRVLHPVNALPGRTWTSIAASVAVTPLPLYTVWHLSNDRWVVLATIVGLNLILVCLRTWRGVKDVPAARMLPSGRHQWLFTVLVAWVGAGVFLFYYLPCAGGRVAVHPAGDYVKHHALLWSLDHDRLPLHNPFYAAGSDAATYYYEHFHLLAAALRILTGRSIAIGTAFGLASAAVAMTCVALVFLLAQAVLKSTQGALLAAACASVIGAWDSLAAVVRYVVTGIPVIILDGWNVIAWRIHTLMHGYLWFPQHIAALCIVLLACYWLQRTPHARWWIVLAPLLAAAVFGSSVYLAMFVFTGAAVYVLVDWYRLARTDPRKIGPYVKAVGVIVIFGGLLMAPRGLSYYAMSTRLEGGATFAWERYPNAFLGQAAPPGPLANWLEAPWLIPVEFGVACVAFLLLSGSAWRRLWKDSGVRLLLLTSIPAVAAMWTIRSNVNPFDYAFRMGTMATLVVGAMCTGALLDRRNVRPFARGWYPPVLAAGLLLGLPVCLYEQPLSAVRSLIEPSLIPADADAIRFMREELPMNAVVQGDPISRMTMLQLVNRQLGVVDPDDSHVNVFCPPDPVRMRVACEEIARAFATDSGDEAYDLLQRWKITHVLVGTNERKRYGDLRQFRDPSRFANLFDGDQGSVYRVRRMDK